MLKGKSGETFWVALKQLESLLLSTLAATLVPPEPKPELSLTTATNCELTGYLSWKLTEESSPGNCWDTIVRTSMLFASGVGP